MEEAPLTAAAAKSAEAPTAAFTTTGDSSVLIAVARVEAAVSARAVIFIGVDD